MKSKKSLKEMSKVPLIKYLKVDHRNQVVTVLVHLKINNSHSLLQLIDDLCWSLEMLGKINSLVLPNLDRHPHHRLQLPPQVMAPIKSLEGVKCTVLMQYQRQEEHN